MLSNNNSENSSEKETNEQNYQLSTLLVTGLQTSDSRHYHSSSVPIYQTATFRQQNADEMGEYDYSRSGNPTRTALENHLRLLMKAEKCFVVNSGMSALDIILRLVSSGQEIVTGNDLYGGTNRLLQFIQNNHEIKVFHVDTSSQQRVTEKVNERTRLLLLETPTNPMMRLVNLREMVELKLKFPNLLICVDNTMLSPLFQNTLEIGVDLEYHSATKYLSGHHDLMAGVIATKRQDLAQKLAYMVNAVGCGLAPFDCFLLSRGLKTLSLRMEKQSQNAQQIAEYLENLGFKVFYPGLKSHPQYELHRKQSKGAGAVLSFITGDLEASKIIVEKTRLFQISVSFGCLQSLISLPCKMSHASIPVAIRKERNLPEDLIRLCIGIEDVGDLIKDLQQAIDEAFSKQ